MPTWEKLSISEMSMLKHFRQMVTGPECLAAHNMSFDEKIVGAELLRAQLPNSLAGKRKICTMETPDP